jgi:hypothetical protein
MSYIALTNSTIDSTPIGVTTPASVNATSSTALWSMVNSFDHGQTAQGGYTMWNLAGAGDQDFVDLKGLGTGAFYWYIGPDAAHLTQYMLLNTAAGGTLNVPNLNGNSATTSAFNHNPSTCVGSASGINAAGNAICNVNGTVLASINFTSCTLNNVGSTDVGCQDTQNWAVNLGTTNYAMTCTLRMPNGFVYGSGDPAEGLTKSTVYTQNLTATGFTYTVSNDHSGAAGLTQGVNCVATHL